MFDVVFRQKCSVQFSYLSVVSSIGNSVVCSIVLEQALS